MKKYLLLLILLSSCSHIKWRGTEVEGGLPKYFYFYNLKYMEHNGHAGVWMSEKDAKILEVELRRCRRGK